MLKVFSTFAIVGYLDTVREDFFAGSLVKRSKKFIRL